MGDTRADNSDQPLLTPPVRRLPFGLIAAVIYLLMTAGMFGDVLLSRDTVVSAKGFDVTTYYLTAREYGFGALRAGRFPLWNAHVYAGTPFAANVQSALFYPPNGIHLILPDVIALNIGVALHFALAAWLMSMWAHACSGAAVPSLLAGVLYACCGGYFLHLHSGHITILHAAAWAPGVFWCVDRITGWGAAVAPGKTSWRWTIALGAMAAMTLLAGHPQTAYYVGVAVAVYGLTHCRQWRGQIGRLGQLLVAAAISIGLAAVQFFPTLEWARDSTRSAGLTAETMRQFAMPAENVFTLILPHIFGGPGQTYLGRWSLSDGSIFAGAAATVLAIYAAATTPRARKLLLVAGVLLLLAGVEPLIQGIARVALPGYSSFRGAGRFGLLVGLMVAMAAAEGLAAMMASRGPSKRAVVGSAIGAVVLLATAGWLTTSPEAWKSILLSLQKSGQAFAAPEYFQDKALIRASHQTAGTQLFAAAAVLTATAGLLAAWRWRPSHTPLWAAALVLLAGAEVLWVARSDRAITPAHPDYPETWAAATKDATAAGQRVATLPLEWANAGMRLGHLDALGYDPTTPARYAKYLAVSQGVAWKDLDFPPPVRGASPLLDALRIGHVLYYEGKRPVTQRTEAPLPRFVWLHQYEAAAGLDDVLTRLSRGADLRQTVLLEQRPAVEPSPGANGTVRVISETPERIELATSSPVPAILLITEAYARGWSATDAAGTTTYELLPANALMRAIPLPAGDHTLVLRYRAPGLIAGAWTSAASLIVLVVAAIALAVPGRPTAA